MKSKFMGLIALLLAALLFALPVTAGINPNSLLQFGKRSGLYLPPVSALSLIQTNLISEFRFMDGSGQVLTDSAGGLNGQRGDSAGVSSDDPTWTAVGQTFDGGDNDLITAAGQAADNGSFTIYVAFKRTNSSVGSGLFGTQTGLTGMHLFIGDNNKIRSQMVLPGGAKYTTETFTTSQDVNYIVALCFESGVRIDTYYGNGASMTSAGTRAIAGSDTAVTAGSTYSLGRCRDDFGTPNTPILTGAMYYAVLYSAAHNSTDRDSVYNYIKSVLVARGLTVN